jgi:Uma2 family endonuclease
MTSKHLTQLVPKPKNMYLATKSSNMSVQIQRRLFTVSEYNKMAEAGILPERGVELINGEIINMSPIGSKHAVIVNKLNWFLNRTLGDGLFVQVQNPIIAGDLSEPEPDLALVRFWPGYYTDRLPNGADVALVIEVAETTFSYDTKVKRDLYAAAGVPEYWVIDLNKEKVHAYWNTQDNKYQNSKVYKKGETLSAQGIDLAIEMDWLWSGQ